MTHATGIRFRWWIIFLIAGVSMLVAALSNAPDPQLQIQSDCRQLPAGSGRAHLTVRSSIPLPAFGLEATIVQGSHSARIARTYFDAGLWHVTVASKALAGNVRV